MKRTQLRLAVVAGLLALGLCGPSWARWAAIQGRAGGFGGGNTAGGGGGAGETLFLEDTFTEGSNTALESHTSDSGGAWTLGNEISFTVNAANDWVNVESDAVSRRAGSNETPPSADYYVEVKGKVDETTSGDVFGPVGRFDEVANDYYDCLIRGDQSWDINVTDNASSVLISSGAIDDFIAFDVGTFYDVRLTMTGDQISCSVNGVQLGATLTNGAVTAAGAAGFFERDVAQDITYIKAAE